MTDHKRINEFLSNFLYVGAFVSVLLLAISAYLVVHSISLNKTRTKENRAANVHLCRQVNGIRTELRMLLQAFKNQPPKGLTPEELQSRYNTLTRAQVRLVDQRCE